MKPSRYQFKEPPEKYLQMPQEEHFSEASDSETYCLAPKLPLPSVKETDITNTDRLDRFLLNCDPKVARAKDMDDSTVRFKYLLGLTDLFRHFIDIKMSKDAKFKKLIKQIDGQTNFIQASKKTRKKLLRGRRKTEKEEDAELMEGEEHMGDPEEQRTVLTTSPSFIKGGKLREYQIQSVNWLIALHENRLSGILADEMGLGKTLQTIAFLGYLRYIKRVDGPFIVIVPKSTLNNWLREFHKWTPEVNVVVLQGNKTSRNEVIRTQLLTAKFDVLVTSFEMVIREKAHLKKFTWQYLIVDEAHRIKNEDLSLSQIIRLFYSKNRLLITGTPLQNNLHELWALLNFLLPDVFGDLEVFDQWFDSQTERAHDHDQDQVVMQLHKVLSPFLLRRVKSDVEMSLLPKIETNVYIGMTTMQIDWYRKLLEKDIDAVNGAVGKREGKTRLLNIVMQLRKCCNHPYLFDGAEPGPPFTTDEHLVFNAGKMIVLDKMLRKFKEDGLRVLIFSQMSRVLDILEDYCFFRDYEYCRIDGSTSHDDRIQAIDDYNDPDSEKFLFLLTTRAGGLGINLTSADIVVLFDSDWNPQADLQAMDRAHRIGQKKQVQVFRFVTENAIEEKVLERAAQKLRLDQLVIQQGRQSTASISNNSDDLLGMIQHGAQAVFDSQSTSTTMLDDDIDAILAKGREKTRTLNAKFNKLGLDDLQNFAASGNASSSSMYEWNGQNFAKKEHDPLKLAWIHPTKRERKEHTYSVDNYYKDMLKAPQASAQAKAKATNNGNSASAGPIKVKQPKIYHPQDHQFFLPQLMELLKREQLAYKKAVGYAYSMDDFGDSDEDFLNNSSDNNDDVPRDVRLREEQKRINEVTPLSEDEVALKETLLSESFAAWSKRDFTNYIHAAVQYGRNSYAQIAESLNRSVDEVERYTTTFWAQFRNIDGHEKYVAQIEASERKKAKLLHQQKLLAAKIEELDDPLEDLRIQYPPNNSKRVFSRLEDRFILCCVYRYGIFAEKLGEKIKQEVLQSDLFKFDWYITSRTPQELTRRVSTLMLSLARESEGPGSRKRAKNMSSKGSVEPSTKENTPLANGASQVETALETDEVRPRKKRKVE